MSAPTLLAAGLAALATLLLWPPPPRRRLLGAAADGTLRARWAATTDRWREGWRPWRRSVPAARRRAVAVEVADALAAELRAGRSVREALPRAAAGHVPVPCPAAVAACGLGGDVVAALRADALAGGVRLWSGVAACWAVGESSGAGLALAVDRVVAAARADEEVRREVEASLAAPRATARVLAVLPAVGIALGTALGADPLGWLLGTPVGLAVAAAGVAAAGLGVWWTGRIAAAVERRL